MKQLLFSTSPIATHIALLLMRVSVSAMMMTHGWAKITKFSEYLTQFPDPLGLGAATSLQLTIFAEFFCSILLALGFMSRLVIIPMAITMVVATTVIHSGDPFADKEMSLLYLVILLFLFLRGPGNISMDAQIVKKNRYR